MKSRIVKSKMFRYVMSFPDYTNKEAIEKAMNSLKETNLNCRAIVLPSSWKVEIIPRFRLSFIVEYIVSCIRGWLYRK